MAIIYTYPSISSVQADDLLLISDDSDGKKTKSVPLSTIKAFVGGGSAAMLTVQTENGGTVVNNVTDIKVTDSTLTDNGNGVVTISTGGGGGTPGTPLNSIQYNDNSTFAGSDNFTYNGAKRVSIKHTLDLLGDGTDAGKVRLYCDDSANTHAVTLEGPSHNTPGVSSYIVKMPAVAPTTGQILEYTNQSQANPYTWVTPTNTGVSETNGVWYPILGTEMGVSKSLQAQGIITETARAGTWRRIGQQMYYDFYIAFTIMDGYPQADNLVIGQAKDITDTSDCYPLPIDTTAPGVGNPTLVSSLKSNGSCQITQASTSDLQKMWTYMPQTGKVGKTEPGIVDLASHNYDPNTWDPSSVNSVPLETVYTQVWWTAGANTTDNILAGTIIGVAS